MLSESPELDPIIHLKSIHCFPHPLQTFWSKHQHLCCFRTPWNKAPRTGGLEQQKCTVSQSWKPVVQIQGVIRAMRSWKAPGKNSFLASVLASEILLVCGNRPPVFTQCSAHAPTQQHLCSAGFSGEQEPRGDLWRPYRWRYICMTMLYPLT